MKTRSPQYRTVLAEELTAVHTLMLAECDTIPEPLKTSIVSLIASRGKQLRPALVLLSSRIWEATETSAILAAAAVEMLHTATLIHDDLIDGAQVRRGLATLNARWSSNAVVLAGDIIFALAAKLIARSGSPCLVERFSETLEAICVGEVRQLFGHNGSVPSIDDYYGRIYAKTGSLFALCLESGAQLANRPADCIDRSRRIGTALGEAFQITDDVLDVIGDATRLGKPVGTDLRQGMATLPVLLYADAHPDDKRLEAVLQRTLDPAAFQQMLTDLRQSNAPEAALKVAKTRATEASLLIRELPDTPPRRALEEIVQFAFERQY